MQLTAEQKEKLREVRKSLVVHTLEKSSNKNELPTIKFHDDYDIINSFYLFTRNRKSEWWIENYEILEIVKKHLMNNINRRKLKEMNEID